MYTIYVEDYAMKHSMKRAALVLTVLMLLSLIPAPALCEDAVSSLPLTLRGEEAWAPLDGGSFVFYPVLIAEDDSLAPAVDRINASYIKELKFLDTIPYPSEKSCDRISYLSVAPMFAEAIDRIYEEVSMGPLFK